jgi:broad specificity phosphatase PhoE
MKYILVRHAQSMFNAGLTDEFDSDLTERGKIQCQEAAMHVKEVMNLTWPDHDHDFAGFVSPYQRTLKTAIGMANRWNIKFTVDHRIGETPTEAFRKFFSVVPNRSADFPDYDWNKFPEEGVDISKRMMEHYWADLAEFVADLPEKAVIVSHMTAIQDLAALLTKKDRHAFHGKDVSNVSMTVIEDGHLLLLGKR